jgi:broad specificity phosphatase PhoE
MTKTALVRLSATMLLLAMLAGCAGMSPTRGSDAATFVVVRHAEKAVDGTDDPALTAAGRRRAEALAASLADSALVGVYSTPLRRARETATPTARMHGLAVTTYEANEPAAAFAARLRREHPAGTVLVVGHSNTAPAIAAALCGCTVGPMPEDEYDRRMTVHVEPDGDVTLLTAPLPAR